MTETAFFLIQYGLAFVFFWTGVLILRDTKGWASLLENSWARRFLFLSSGTTMRAVAVFDLAVGIWLATGFALQAAAVLAALHLASVILVTGIMKPTYRDVGLLAMALALLF